VSAALLEGRVVLVTGGAGGIGEGICRSVAQHGATVVVADHDRERTDALVEELRAAGHEAHGVVVDVLEPGAARDLVERTVGAAGGLDVLVNNVGHYLYAGRRFHESDEEQWEALHDVNLRHVLRMCHAALPVMVSQGRGGSIINLTTVEASRGIPRQAVYGAYKAAVAHFTTCLALDVAEHGIRVNAIAPDVTTSRQLPYERWVSDEEREKLPQWVPLSRFGEPADCGGVAVFLASELSSFVTGTSIPVDGGTGAAGGWYRTTHGRSDWTNRPFDP